MVRTATTSTCDFMSIIMMVTVRPVANIMAIIIIIIKTVGIDHEDGGVCEADTIVTHTTRTRCV